jgi:hypothetical protein
MTDDTKQSADGLTKEATEALRVLRKHHEWHQEYDEHGGYVDSELEVDTTSAIIGLRNALSNPTPKPVTVEAVGEEESMDTWHHVVTHDRCQDEIARLKDLAYADDETTWKQMAEHLKRRLEKAPRPVASDRGEYIKLLEHRLALSNECFTKIRMAVTGDNDPAHQGRIRDAANRHAIEGQMHTSLFATDDLAITLSDKSGSAKSAKPSCNPTNNPNHICFECDGSKGGTE